MGARWEDLLMFRSKCVNKLLAGIANSCRFSIACHLHFNSAKKIEEKHIRIKFGFSSQYVSFDFALESTIKGIKIGVQRFSTTPIN